jgi:putative flippase GtrA
MKIPQFVRYCIVGAFGAGVQRVIFFAFTRWFGVPNYVTLGEIALPSALGLAILSALASNFYFNKYWTFTSKRDHASAWAV